MYASQELSNYTETTYARQMQHKPKVQLEHGTNCTVDCTNGLPVGRKYDFMTTRGIS